MDVEKAKELLKTIKDKRRDASKIIYELDDLIKNLEVEVMGIPPMPFGKHAGKPLNELPPHYVAWLLATGSLDKWENRELKESLTKLYKETEEGEQK